MMALSAANQVRVIDKDAFEYYDSWKNQVVRENVYEQTDKSVVGSKEGLTLAIRMMHREMGRLGIESIDQFSPENRNVTGVTLGVNREGYEEIVRQVLWIMYRLIRIWCFLVHRGKSPYSPYVNIGFNVAGFDSNGVALSTDISDWNGLCIAYSIATPFDVVLDLGDSLNKKLEYALPAVSLPKSHFGVVECVSWDDFDMPDWARDNEYKITGEEAAKHVVRIVFRIRNQPGSYDFNIYAVGTNLN
jgi:hypothetical protein